MTQAPDNLDNLKSLDLDAIPSFYGEPAAARNTGAGLAHDRKHIGRYAHTCLDMTQVANAAETLDHLPATGETFHIVCRGNWPAWALVPAFLRLSPGATIQTLHIATLGFSRDNADQLLSLMDAGTIRTTTMVISCYFRSNEAMLVDYLAQGMTSRGHRFAAVRNHAKIIAAGMSNGDALVVESSANLRSCRNVEQFTITNSPDLLHFHQRWIETIVAGGDER